MGACMLCYVWLVSFVTMFFFFKQKTAYEVRISDWSSDVCSSDLDDFEVGKISLPHLVRPGGFGVELIGGLDHDIGRAGDQIMGLQQAVNRGFRDEVALLVGEAHRQLSR